MKFVTAAFFMTVLALSGVQVKAQDQSFVLAESMHDEPIIATGRVEADGVSCPQDDKSCIATQSRKFVVKSPKIWLGKFNDEVMRNGRVRLFSTARETPSALNDGGNFLLILYGRKPSDWIPMGAHRAIPITGTPDDPTIHWDDEVAKMLPCGASTLVLTGSDGGRSPKVKMIRVASLVNFIRTQKFEQEEFYCNSIGTKAWQIEVPAGMVDSKARLIAKCEVKFIVDRNGRTDDIEVVKFSGSERLRDTCRIKTQQMRVPVATDAKGLPKRTEYRTNFDFDEFGLTTFWFGPKQPKARVYFSNSTLGEFEKTYVDAKGILRETKDIDYREVTVVGLPSGATIQPRGLSEGMVYMPAMGSVQANQPVFGKKADLVIVSSNPKCRNINDISVIAYIDGATLKQRQDVRVYHCFVRGNTTAVEARYL